MEPIAHDPRLKDVHADIPELESLAASRSRHATDLQDVSSRLAAAPPQPEAFGAVGARFLAALRDAVARDVDTAAALSDELRSASATVSATAAAYGDADHRAGFGVGSAGV